MSQSTEDQQQQQQATDAKVFAARPATTTELLAEGNGQTGKESQSSQQITDSSSVNTAWGTYLNTLNSKYQNKIKEAAQKSKYTLTIRNANGQDELLTFTRMKLLQYQYDEIEDLRAESTEAAENRKQSEANHLLRQMYERAATYILWNVREKRPMSIEEYKNSVFSEVRPALDSSILLGLISDPN